MKEEEEPIRDVSVHYDTEEDTYTLIDITDDKVYRCATWTELVALLRTLFTDSSQLDRVMLDLKYIVDTGETPDNWEEDDE